MRIRNEIIMGSVISSIILIGAYRSAIIYQSNLSPLSPLTSGTNTTSGTSEGINITLTTGEVAKHNTSADCWMIVEGVVYNITSYLPVHPGGAGQITPYCGKDGTAAFATKGGQGSHSQNANTDLSSLKIGALGTTLDASALQQLQQNTTNNIPTRQRRFRDN